MKTHKSELELESVYSRIAKREIDLQPDFQRGEIWDTPRKQRLIDTILRNWYVPAIHIVKDGDGNEEVLDGQQRLASIRDFFEDKFPVGGSVQPSNAAVEALDGLRFSKLPESVKKAIRRYTLPIVTLSEFDPQEPNELFFRLNQSYNLTPPEKRNALHGEARNQVRSLVHDLEGLGLLQREAIGFSNGRLAYDDIIARTCVAIEMNTLRQHINNNVVELYYRQGDGFSGGTVEGVRDAARVLLSQISTLPKRVKFNKGTLQTWLLYAFWAPRETGPLPSDLLADFEMFRDEHKRSDDHLALLDYALVDIVSVYEDRASYRVTDVSSVLARDLAIHLFSAERFDTQPVASSELVLSVLSDEPHRRARQVMFEFLDDSSWGEAIVGR